MDKAGLVVFFVALLGPLSLYAEQRDTLFSANRDRVIVSWEVAREGNRCTVRFEEVRKKLGGRNKERYRRLDEIVVLFFDRTGNYNEVTFSNMIPEAFMVPARIGYEKSEEGYFCLNEQPSLTFMTEEADAELSIPVYLAHYEGKRKYRLFERCGPLVLRLDNPKRETGASGSRTEFQTVVSSMVQEADNREITDLLTRIAMVRALLAEQTKLPFSESLQYEISSLRIKKEQVKNPELLDKINEVLIACEAKKQELAAEERNLRMEQEEAKRAARQEKEEARRLQEQQQEQQRQEAAAAKKRSFWMIVGGAILAVLCFVGNQLMQHFRNRMNQRNMMEMQQSIARRAESEVKRNARNAVQKKVRQIETRLTDAAKLGKQGKPQGHNMKKKNISI